MTEPLAIFSWEISMALAGIMLVTGVIVVRNASRLAVLLKERHRRLWTSLGEPAIRLGPEGSNIWKLHDLAFGRIVAGDLDSEVLASRRWTRRWLVLHYLAGALFAFHFVLTWMG